MYADYHDSYMYVIDNKHKTVLGILRIHFNVICIYM